MNEKLELLEKSKDFEITKIAYSTYKVEYKDGDLGAIFREGLSPQFYYIHEDHWYKFEMSDLEKLKEFCSLLSDE